MVPSATSIISPEKNQSNRKDCIPHSQHGLRRASCGPKVTAFQRGPGIDCSKNAIDVLVNQRSAFSSETYRVGELMSGLAVGSGEWEGTSRVFVQRRAGDSPAQSSLSSFPHFSNLSSPLIVSIPSRNIHLYVHRPLRSQA